MFDPACEVSVRVPCFVLGAVGVFDVYAFGVVDPGEAVVVVLIFDKLGAGLQICGLFGGDVAVGVVGVGGEAGVKVVDGESPAHLVVGDNGGVAVGVNDGGDLAEDVVGVGGGDLLAVVVLRYREDPAGKTAKLLPQ